MPGITACVTSHRCSGDNALAFMYWTLSKPGRKRQQYNGVDALRGRATKQKKHMSVVLG